MKITNASKGGKLYSDTTSHTPEGQNSGPWGVVQILNDTKFHTLSGTLDGVANTTSGSAPSIPAGTVLEGQFTTLQLHSGSVIAYYA